MVELFIYRKEWKVMNVLEKMKRSFVKHGKFGMNRCNKIKYTWAVSWNMPYYLTTLIFFLSLTNNRKVIFLYLWRSNGRLHVAVVTENFFLLRNVDIYDVVSIQNSFLLLRRTRHCNYIHYWNWIPKKLISILLIEKLWILLLKKRIHCFLTLI